MPDPIPSTTSSSKPKGAPGRFGIGLNVLLQVLLGLAIFGGVNKLSYMYYTRWDLSPESEFTLNSSTLNYLRRQSKEISLTVISQRDSKVYADMQSLIEEYRRNGKGLVKIEFIDPVLDLERTEQFKAENKLTLPQGGVLVKANKGMRFIPEDQMIIRTKGMDADHPQIWFRGEDAITSAIVGLMEGAQRRFYFITGKGSRSESRATETFATLQELGRQQNFDVQPLNLAVDAVPKDANGLILTGAKYDLSDRELDVLRSYWGTKRASVLVMLDPSSETPRLLSFLNSMGVGPRNDRVLYAESTSTGPRKEFSVEARFSKDVPITSPLSDATTKFEGQTQSLTLATRDDALKQQGIALAPLIIASPRYWGETDYLNDLPVVSEGDAVPPLYLAAAVERGAVADERLRVNSARLVVVGNATLLDKQTRLAQNQDFIASALNWMLNRERLIGVIPKPKGQYRVQLNDKQRELLFWITALCAPGIVLLFGFSVWAGRRAS
ncbi:MAG: ABC-type uncharacterized transport system [Verrucomicrobiaceae bacterium]|nr:ABC-type uncharacterized transport system [Verrucomicrobiaceae bacterium]